MINDAFGIHGYHLYEPNTLIQPIIEDEDINLNEGLREQTREFYE